MTIIYVDLSKKRNSLICYCIFLEIKPFWLPYLFCEFDIFVVVCCSIDMLEIVKYIRQSGGNKS